MRGAAGITGMCIQRAAVTFGFGLQGSPEGAGEFYDRGDQDVGFEQ